MQNALDKFPTIISQLMSWFSKYSKRFTLFSMLGLAAIFHILGFYLFKIVSPSSQPSPLSPATFYLLKPDSTLNGWLESEDPSLITGTTTPSSHNILPKIPYIPSYESESFALAIPQKPALHISIPRGPAAASIALSTPLTSSPKNASPHSQSVVAGTRLVLGGGLSNRSLQTLPSGGLLVSPANANHLPCTFLALVNPEGQFLHLFLLHSSGNLELDHEAMRNLQQVQLKPIPTTKSSWGTVTYSWGLTN